MERFHHYTPEDAIYANLQESAQRAGMICEQEISHLSELASELVRGIDTSSLSTTSIFEFLPKYFFKKTDVLSQHANMIEKAQSCRSVWLDVVLSEQICKRLTGRENFSLDDFFTESDEGAFDAKDRIAYQSNSYADAAYLRFSSLLNNPRMHYTNNFPAACEAVFDGRCEFCILPLENSSEGILNSFLRLIDRFSLCICATCDITSADHSRSTKFALLRRTLTPFRPEKGGKQYFEFSCPIDQSPSPSDILTAAELCALSLCRIDTHIRQTDEKEMTEVRFLFDISDGMFSVFLLYLTMRARGIVWRGLYPHL